jgi:trigger factor
MEELGGMPHQNRVGRHGLDLFILSVLIDNVRWTRMEYELKDNGPSRKVLSFKFSAEDVNGAFDKSYDNINGYVSIKGFRKGRAPRAALVRRFATEAAEGVQQELLQHDVRKVIEDEKLRVFGPMNLKNPSVRPEQGKEYSIDVEFDVIPDFELPEYKGVELSEREVNVDEARVDEALERYRRMFADYKPVDEPARKEDVIEVNFIARHGDEEIMAMNDQRLRVDGDILFGLPCPDLVEKFTGAKKDDVIHLRITLPEDHSNPELRGKDADIVVTVLKVNRGNPPEMNDAFAEGLGMGNLEQFRERIKNNLIREAYAHVRQEEELEIIGKLVEKTSFDLPEAAVKAEAEEMVNNYRQQLIRAGAKPGAAMEEQLVKFRPDAEKDAGRKLRWTFIATRIAEKEEIKVTNEDLAAQVEALAENYRISPAKIIQRIREMDGMDAMMAEILSIKVMNYLVQESRGGSKIESAAAKDFNEAASAVGKSLEDEGDSKV